VSSSTPSGPNAQYKFTRRWYKTPTLGGTWANGTSELHKNFVTVEAHTKLASGPRMGVGKERKECADGTRRQSLRGKEAVAPVASLRRSCPSPSGCSSRRSRPVASHRSFSSPLVYCLSSPRWLPVPTGTAPAIRSPPRRVAGRLHDCTNRPLPFLAWL
jgi:hypothetical protein